MRLYLSAHTASILCYRCDEKKEKTNGGRKSMIIIAIAYIVIMTYEVYYMKRRSVPIKPYVVLYCFMFIASELLYFFKDEFQLITLIKVLFAPIESILLFK